MTAKLILIRGSPASGKSTLARSIAKQLPGKVSLLIYDEFKWVMTYHDDRSKEDFAISRRNYLFALENYLAAEYTVITECAWTYEQAQQIVETAERYGAEVTQILLVGDKKTVKHLNTLRSMIIPDDELMETYQKVYAVIGDEHIINIDEQEPETILNQAIELIG